MASYRKINEKTVRNTVHKAGPHSTIVRVPLSWIGKEVEIKIVEK